MRPITAFLAVLALSAAGTSPVVAAQRIAPSSLRLVQRYQVAGHPASVAVGSDGNVWFTDPNGGKLTGAISRLELPGGRVDVFSLPQKFAVFATGLLAHDDGNLWFVENVPSGPGNHDLLEYITPGGQIFPAPGVHPDTAQFQTVTGLANAPDGSVWDVYSSSCEPQPFCGSNVPPTVQPPGYLIPNAVIGDTAYAAFGKHGELWLTISGLLVRMEPTTGQAVRETTIAAGPIAAAPSRGIAVWFLTNGGVGRIDEGSGRLETFALPASEVPTSSNLVADADGAVWFGISGGRVGRLSQSGRFSSLTVGQASDTITGVALAAGGGIWFGDAAGSIGRVR